MLELNRYLEIPLPEDVEKAKWCGDFDRALRLIHRKLSEGKLPFAARKRLELEEHILRRLPLDYRYSEEEGLALLREHIPDFTREELQELEDSGAIDWIYIQGKPHFSSSFYDTLEKVYPDIARRAGLPPAEESKERKLLYDTVKKLEETGSAASRIRLRAHLRVADSAFRPGEPLLVHLPIPAPAVNMENIQILECSPQPARIAPETAGQRTVSFACAPQENPLFTVEYQYDCRAVYRPLDPEKVSPLQPDFDTQEQAPHSCRPS